MADKPRVGLTGASGVLGRTLCAQGNDIEWIPFVGDVSDGEKVQQWMSSAHVDAVFHLAAIVPTIDVERDPARALAVNVGGTINLLEAVRRLPASTRPWTCVASSSHVYQSSPAPIAEDGLIAPVSLYGLTKYQAEQWGLAYAAHFGLDVCVARIFSFSDPRQAPSYFIPATIQRIRSAATGASLEIRGANDHRDFLSSSDVASALECLRAARACGVFNVASGSGARILEVVDHARRLLQREDVVLIPATEGVPSHLVADVGKLLGLGWSPSGSWRDLVSAVAKT